jgi:hypothetical protein
MLVTCSPYSSALKKTVNCYTERSVTLNGQHCVYIQEHGTLQCRVRLNISDATKLDQEVSLVRWKNKTSCGDINIYKTSTILTRKRANFQGSSLLILLDVLISCHNSSLNLKPCPESNVNSHFGSACNRVASYNLSCFTKSFPSR